MAPFSTKTTPFLCITTLAILLCVVYLGPTPTNAAKTRLLGTSVNEIDRCWRRTPNWARNRHRLAMCSVGFSGKMTNNIGKGTVEYVVTDPGDDPLRPKPGTLRYGASLIKEKVWITFARDMKIKLQNPLLISSFTAIDGRGANVEIGDGPCLVVYKATDVIIHNLRILSCKPQGASRVIGPGSEIIELGQVDGDAIRLVSVSRVWIDHNTMYTSQDGLLDVTRGSTAITISNNWFRDQDKVMLLGHDDGYLRDKNMKVTVVYNHFGPNCNQRMPRLRHGYAHVANNLYQGWQQYAIGGSMGPRIKSESNLFIAPQGRSKEVTWRLGNGNAEWSFYSVRDKFENGASFRQTGRRGAVKPQYNKERAFRVMDVNLVRALTKSSGALKCSTRRSRC